MIDPIEDAARPTFLGEWATPTALAAHMARQGLHDLWPWWDPERGHVDPLDDAETRATIRSFLAALFKASRKGSGLLDRLREAEAENERHRRANLVRAVTEGFDEWIGEAIAAEDWDAVPWKVAAALRSRVEKAEQALREAEADLTRVGEVLDKAGISDHEGGGGDTYYERPAWHRVEELAAFQGLYEDECSRAEKAEQALRLALEMLRTGPGYPVSADDECLTCGELDGAEGECPNSKRPCGHHCNCSWIHDCCHWCGGTGGPGGRHRKPRNLEEAREAMGMPWASRKELSQAVPPAYTQFIGEQLLRAIEVAV